MLVAKIAHFTIGAFVLSYGIDITRLAHLGLSPWDVLHEGIALISPISFGVATIVVGIVLIVAAHFLGIRPRFGTIVNMVIIGIMIDVILVWNLIPLPDTVSRALGLPFTGVRYGYVIIGAVVLGIGTAWYVTANLGAGPRDSLMLGLAHRSGWQVGTVRTLMEGTALLAGWAIGGPVGVGTIISALLMGWTIQGALAVFRRLAQVPLLSGLIELPLMNEGTNHNGGDRDEAE